MSLWADCLQAVNWANKYCASQSSPCILFPRQSLVNGLQTEVEMLNHGVQRIVWKAWFMFCKVSSQARYYPAAQQSTGTANPHSCCNCKHFFFDSIQILQSHIRHCLRIYQHGHTYRTAQLAFSVEKLTETGPNINMTMKRNIHKVSVISVMTLRIRIANTTIAAATYWWAEQF